MTDPLKYYQRCHYFCNNVMRCAIWYGLYNLKNVKNTHGGVLLLPFNLTKCNTPPWVFSRFLNCTNGSKSCKTSHIFSILLERRIVGRLYYSRQIEVYAQ